MEVHIKQNVFRVCIQCQRDQFLCPLVLTMLGRLALPACFEPPCKSQHNTTLKLTNCCFRDKSQGGRLANSLPRDSAEGGQFCFTFSNLHAILPNWLGCKFLQKNQNCQPSQELSSLLRGRCKPLLSSTFFKIFQEGCLFQF